MTPRLRRAREVRTELADRGAPRPRRRSPERESAAGPRLQQLAFRYREARALYAGLELGVFEAIGHGAREASALAAELGCAPRALRVLLDALAALGALERVRAEKPGGDGERSARGSAAYALAPGCAPLLLRGGGEYLGDVWQLDLWNWSSWARAERAVRSGEPERDYARDPHLGDPQIAARFFPTFVRAMEQSASPWLAALADQIAALAPRWVMDLGGGSGGLLLAVLERAPGARGTLLEHAFSLERARERAAAHPAGTRLEAVAADIERAPLPQGADVLLLCRVLMGLPPERAQPLLERAAAALAPGGALLICDFDPRSRVGALLSLDALLHAGGEAHSAAALRRWLAGAGLAVREAARPAPYLRTWVARRAPAAGEEPA